MPRVSATSSILPVGNTWISQRSAPRFRLDDGLAYPGIPKQSPCNSRWYGNGESISTAPIPTSPRMRSSACLTASSFPRHNPSRNASTSRASSAAHSNHSIITRRNAWRSSPLGRRKVRERALFPGSSTISVVRKPDRYNAVQTSSTQASFDSTAPRQSGASTHPCGSSKSNRVESLSRFQSPTALLRLSAYPYKSARTGGVQPRFKKSITRAGLEQ